MRVLVSTAAVLFAAGCLLDPAGTRSPGGPTDGDAEPDSSADADACSPSPELCNGLDDDCDGRVDEGFDLDSDPGNCGACGRLCPADPPNGSAECLAGRCLVACDPGFRDCDELAATGCEASLSAPSSCGGCEVACGGARPLCQGTTERGFVCVSECSEGRVECDGSCADLAADPRNCGECGLSCPSPPHAFATCVSGSCAYSCDAGFGDCTPEDGCERSLRTLSDCGGCGLPCDLDHGSESCASGRCELESCDEGFEDCDDAPENGCERPVRTLSDCGGCGLPCDLDHATESCASGRCELTGCAPGFGDCNDEVGDGCEADLTTAADCGRCGAACPAPGVCLEGRCTGDCPAGCACHATCPPLCSCSGGCPCAITCPGACSASCADSGTSCMVDLLTNRDLSGFLCSAGASCLVDFQENHNMTGTCRNLGTSCEVLCRSSHSCLLVCEAGAACRIRCDRTRTCRFESCDGPEATCEDGSVVCNRECP